MKAIASCACCGVICEPIAIPVSYVVRRQEISLRFGIPTQVALIVFENFTRNCLLTVRELTQDRAAGKCGEMNHKVERTHHEGASEP